MESKTSNKPFSKPPISTVSNEIVKSSLMNDLKFANPSITNNYYIGYPQKDIDGATQKQFELKKSMSFRVGNAIYNFYHYFPKKGTCYKYN